MVSSMAHDRFKSFPRSGCEFCVELLRKICTASYIFSEIALFTNYLQQLTGDFPV
jgi:hypothetical protein